jgi:transcriptional regulator of acetoin/glycerol metabolism
MQGWLKRGPAARPVSERRRLQEVDYREICKRLDSLERRRDQIEREVCAEWNTLVMLARRRSRKRPAVDRLRDAIQQLGIGNISALRNATGLQRSTIYHHLRKLGYATRVGERRKPGAWRLTDASEAQ